MIAARSYVVWWVLAKARMPISTSMMAPATKFIKTLADPVSRGGCGAHSRADSGSAECAMRS